jgi:hypothetical protein
MRDHSDTDAALTSPAAATAGALPSPPTGLERRPALALSASELRGVVSVLSLPAALLALLALGTLGVRAALRLELRWDTFAYHLPYAALRGGLPISYELSEKLLRSYQGYPPLPNLLQGALWRLTGSMNATGVVNYLALAAFLAYCHRVLLAPFWLVALISLTAPMVIIHSSVSYVDLFGNCLLAAGVCSCLSLFLFPERARRAVLLGGLLGLAGAAWSKYLLVPIAAPALCVLAALAVHRPHATGFSRRQVAWLCAFAALLAAWPYLKNLALYGNPFWPIRVPFLSELFPFRNDAIKGGIREVPPQLRDASQGFLFLQSFFEIGHPTRYPERARWIIDQGNASITFRMGGFWGVAAVVYLLAVIGLLLGCQRRRGAVAALGVLSLLTFVAWLPQSHQLRYYLFIPLSGAAAVGMLFPRLGRIAPGAAAALLTLALGLFVHMLIENWVHYRIERVGQAEAARFWQADRWWPKLEPGKTYCAIDMQPMAMLLAGPTLSEYRIVGRYSDERCPAGSERITFSSFDTL